MGRSRSSERMQRSASPPSRRRRRSPSPRRRHSRSPRRRSSPDYRPYQPERTSRDSRQQRGDGTRSGRGRQRDNQEDYISDDDIKAESYQELYDSSCLFVHSVRPFPKVLKTMRRAHVSFCSLSSFFSALLQPAFETHKDDGAQISLHLA
jgi:hypothetical protein